MNKKLLGFILFIAVLTTSLNIGTAADMSTNTGISVSAVVSGAAVDYPAEGGTIKFNTNTGAVTGFAGSIKSVSIPAQINGTAVKAIDNYAFKNCRTLEKAVIPPSVVSIGGEAFYGCDKSKLVLHVVKGSAAEKFAVYYAYKAEYTSTELTTEGTTVDIRFLPVGMFAKRYKWKGITTTTEETTEETTDTLEENGDEEGILTGDVRVTIGSSVITVGNKEFVVDAAPYIQPESNSTLVPLRFVAVAISGGDVEKAQDSSMINWDNNTKTATIDTGEKTISFTAGSADMLVDSTPVTMDNGVKAEITGGRMFIPLRALGNALGVNVYWDAENKTALYSEK